MLRSPVFGTFPLVPSCVVVVHGPVSCTRGIESLLKLFSPKTFEIPSEAGTFGASVFA